jgi:hypothetical protein
MRVSAATLFFVVALPTTAAFSTSTPRSLQQQQQRRLPQNAPLSAVTVDDGLTTAAIGTAGSRPLATDHEQEQRTGAMMDLTGIAFSGLKGQALSLETFPKANELRSVIPADCFEPDTLRSLGYLSVSLAGTALCTAVGAALATGVLNPANPLTWPIWAAYAAVTGTVAMGCWVLVRARFFLSLSVYLPNSASFDVFSNFLAHTSRIATSGSRMRPRSLLQKQDVARYCRIHSPFDYAGSVLFVAKIPRSAPSVHQSH